ncbi:MAG: methionyl-tRNA formyltransferase [Opitutaceae bacterium]
MTRLVFMGSDPIALPLLEALAGRIGGPEIVALYTQPDRPSGRGQQVRPNPVKLWAMARGIEVLQPDRLDETERLKLESIRPDLILVMAYGHLLRQSWLDTPPRGIYNLHTSLLPEYRGASPIQATVLEGDVEGGVTLMKMVARLDAGPVVDLERVRLDPLETAATLEAKLAAACVPLVQRNLDSIGQGIVVLRPQDDSRATFTRRLRKADGVLDFSASAEMLARRINGLFPWPGVNIKMGDLSIRCGLAEALPEAGGDPPGRVLGFDAAGLRVATGSGVLRIRRLQRPGGRMLEATEFARGFPIPEGTLFDSQAMPVLVGNEPLRA